MVKGRTVRVKVVKGPSSPSPKPPDRLSKNAQTHGAKKPPNPASNGKCLASGSVQATDTAAAAAAASNSTADSPDPAQVADTNDTPASECFPATVSNDAMACIPAPSTSAASALPAAGANTTSAPAAAVNAAPSKSVSAAYANADTAPNAAPLISAPTTESTTASAVSSNAPPAPAVGSNAAPLNSVPATEFNAAHASSSTSAAGPSTASSSNSTSAICSNPASFSASTPAADLNTAPDSADTDDDDFILVQRRKKKGNAPQPAHRHISSRPSVTVAPPPRTQSEFPAFRIPSQPGFLTSYDAVAALEDSEPALKTRNLIGKDGSSVLVPLDEESYRILNAMAADPGASIKATKIAPQVQTTKGVLMGYPLRMPLTIITRHPQVEDAERCQTSHHQEDTRQVLVTLRGPLVSSLTLGNWGTFYLRPYTPEPLRCHKCQRFGHHQANCSRKAICGICSGHHNTEQCLTKYKAKEAVTHRCPNCGAPHHAWNPVCPARIAHVNRNKEHQANWVNQQQRTAATPAPPGTFVWGQQRKASTTLPPPPPPPPAPSEFPSLPLTPQMPPTPPPTTSAPAPPQPTSPLPPTPAEHPSPPLTPLLPQMLPTPATITSAPALQTPIAEPIPAKSMLAFTAEDLQAFGKDLAMSLASVLVEILGLSAEKEKVKEAVENVTGETVSRALAGKTKASLEPTPHTPPPMSKAPSRLHQTSGQQAVAHVGLTPATEAIERERKALGLSVHARPKKRSKESPSSSGTY